MLEENNQIAVIPVIPGLKNSFIGKLTVTKTTGFKAYKVTCTATTLENKAYNFSGSGNGGGLATVPELKQQPVSGFLSMSLDEMVEISPPISFTFTNVTGSNLVVMSLESQVIGLIF